VQSFSRVVREAEPLKRMLGKDDPNFVLQYFTCGEAPRRQPTRRAHFIAGDSDGARSRRAPCTLVALAPAQANAPD
jgi:hypothetical protein